MGPIFSIVGSVFDLILRILEVVGLPGLFALMVVESFGLPPLPSEVILPFAGVLIVRDAAGFTWPTVVLVALAGGVVGAGIAYEVGRWGGRGVIRRWGRQLHLGEEDLARAERFFERRGPITVALARLIPLARAYISYPAGAAEMARGRFYLYTAVGALPFTVAMVYLGTLLGNDYTELQPWFNALDVVVVVAAVIFAVWYALRVHRHRSASPPAPTA